MIRSPSGIRAAANACRRWFALLAFGLLATGFASEAAAAERYALIVTGASGGDDYAQKYDTWRETLLRTLKESLGYPDDHVVALTEHAAAPTEIATGDNVRRALKTFETRATKEDVLLIVLIGHGTAADEDVAKFNLVGPDLSIDEWAALLRPIPGRLVFVDTASGSFPFLRRLAGRGRIVVTANDSAAQTFETIFPEFFIKAFDDDSADLDKNGKLSIWEAFIYASDRVKAWYEQKGQLATERPLIDDTGAGVGREAGADGADGTVAQVTYLRPERKIAETGDNELTALLRRKAELETNLEALRAKKATLTPAEYDDALEELLVDIAQVDRRIREKQP